MKKIIATILTIAFALSFTACGPKPAEGWQEEIDRGIAAVEADDYTTAVEAFEAAITIDPIWEEAYTRLKNLHITNGDIDAAIGTLKTAAENLENGEKYADEAKSLMNSKNIYLSGDLYELDENGRISKILYTASWNEGEYDIIVYDESGRVIEITEYTADGEYDGCSVFTYDENGNIIVEQEYYADGEPGTETQYKYDEDNCLTEESYESWLWGGLFVASYDKEGKTTTHCIYNDDGKLSTKYVYDEDMWTDIIEYYYSGDVTLEKVYDRDFVVQKKIYYNAYSSGLDTRVDLYCDYDDEVLVSEIAYYAGTQDLVSEKYYNPDGTKDYDVAHNDKEIIIVQ